MITLPSNVQWVTDDLAVAVIPGREQIEYGFIPGAEWEYVAPQEWEQYDKPGSWWCEECHASWLEGDQCWKCGNRTRYPVGRQVWEVRWSCPKCHPFNGDPDDGGRCQTCGIKYHCARCNHPCNLMATGHGVGKCEPHESVVSARATIQVVPVVKGRSDHRPDPPYLAVYEDSGGWGILVLGDVSKSLALDPLPVPGRDWVLVVRKAA